MEDDLAEWLSAFQTIKEAQSDEQDVKWYDCADRIYTPDQKPLQITPSTPEREEQPPGIIFPVFQLPPPSQPIVSPVFALTRRRTARTRRGRMGTMHGVRSRRSGDDGASANMKETMAVTTTSETR